MILVFTVFTLTVGILCLRLYVVCTGSTEYVASGSHGYTIDIGSERGDICDCRGEKLVNTQYDNVVAAKPTMKAASVLRGIFDGSETEYLEKRMKNGNAVFVNIGKRTVPLNSDVIMLRKYVRYENKQPARHIIGYINGDGRGVTGIEKSFDGILYTDKKTQVRFSADPYGRIISGAAAEIINDNAPVGSVTLTIDKRIQIIAEKALDSCSIEEGGVVVTDVSSGAVRALASRPDFDTDNLAAYLNADNAPLVNRGLEAYSVGSVFKIAVAAAALEKGLDNFTCTCGGSCDINGTEFGCSGHTAHGTVDMKKALECSCNIYFINLARAVGKESLIEMADNIGFGQEIKLADGITAKSGTIPTLDELESVGQLANFSFGQGKFTATMLQLAQMVMSVANGGKYNVPYLVEKTVSPDGEEETHRSRYPVVAFSRQTSEKLGKMLVSVVENGSASKAKPENGITVAGKTATAQTGTYDENGADIYNTWFCGFFPAESPKYAVVVLKQNGSTGAQDCAPVFREIAEKISSLQ